MKPLLSASVVTATSAWSPATAFAAGLPQSMQQTSPETAQHYVMWPDTPCEHLMVHFSEEDAAAMVQGSN